MRIVRTHGHARAGLVGNPSDQFGGRTISFAFREFSARAVIYDWPELEIVPGPSDQVRFPDLTGLLADVEANGYYGGLRLTKAAIVRFAHWCRDHSIEPERPFSIRYETSIPRGVGLGGSSAIVTAVMRGLCEFHGVEVPKEELPTLVLSAESEELGIAAGLQDRVAQVYEGLTFMDFGLAAERGYGEYEPLDPGLLPPLLIAYRPAAAQPSDEAHAAVRGRFSAGDAGIAQAMEEIAGLADRAKEALLAGDHEELGGLMTRNLELRAGVYELDPGHLRMAEIANEVGLSANYAGSGGAVVILGGDTRTEVEFAQRLSAEGCLLLRPTIVAPKSK